MSSAPRLAVVGEAIVVFVNTPAEPALQFRGPFVSGAPVIFAATAAKLGAAVQLACGVGDDDFGSLFDETLAAHGVERGGLVVDPTLPTSAAFVSYRDDASRDFIFYLDGTAALAVPTPEPLLGDAEWLHVSGSTLTFGGELAETCWSAVEAALRAGVGISFDPNVREHPGDPRAAQRITTLLAHADVILASVGELDRLGASTEQLVARGALVCEKLGARGAVVTGPSGRLEVPAPEVTEVDPDGAGDVFAAAFVTARLLGHSDVDATRQACAVAADSVTRWGPLTGDLQPLADRRR